MAGQLLTLAERMYSLTQDIGVTDREPIGGRGGPHMAHSFWDSLRSDTFRVVPASGMPTLREAVDMALWVEREQAIARARQGNHEPSQGPKRPNPYLGEGTSRKNRSSKLPKTKHRNGCTHERRQQPGTKPCIICGERHGESDCPWKLDHYYKCGKPGHLRSSCPRGRAIAPAAP